MSKIVKRKYTKCQSGNHPRGKPGSQIVECGTCHKKYCLTCEGNAEDNNCDDCWADEVNANLHTFKPSAVRPTSCLVCHKNDYDARHREKLNV